MLPPHASTAGLTGLEALNQFCAATGFNGEIWLQVSWQHESIDPPTGWKLKQDGSPVNYIYSGQITSDSFTVSLCQFKNDRWQPSACTIDGYPHLRELAELGATIYFYPNQPHGGISNENVSSCDLLFYEIDNLPLDQQWQRLNDLIDRTNLRPSAIVFTGGKSLHVYFKLSSKITSENWKKLNRKLAIIQQSDPAICNPARAMRLPGMVRRKSVNGELLPAIDINLESYSDATYTPEEFEKALDSTGLFPYGLTYERWLKWRKHHLAGEADKAIAILHATEEEISPKYEPIANTERANYNGELIPLEWCLSREDKDLLASGVVEHQGRGRDNSAYKLARNLIGTANQLRSLGYSFSGEPETLFNDFCSKCSPSLPERDRQRIWKSASKGNPSASLPTAIIEDIVSRYVGFKNKKFSPRKSNQISEKEWREKFGKSCQKDATKIAEILSDFSEPDLTEYLQYLANESEREKVENAQESENCVNSLKNLFSKFGKKLSQKFGFSKKTEQQTEETEKPQFVIENYDLSDRHAFWEQKHAEGKKYILDMTGTGGFKSSDAGKIDPARFGLNHALYIHKDYRNTTVETLSLDNGWTTVDGRNPGLKQDDLGKWRVVKPGEAYAVTGNCTRTQTINAIRSYGVENADNSDLACKGCNNYEICRAATTNGVGYLNQRATKLNAKDGEQKKLIMHPASLPDTTPKVNAEGEEICFPHSETIKFWEESSDSFTNAGSIEVTLSDVEKLTTHLLGYPELLNALTPVLVRLSGLLDGTVKQPNLFGWSHNKLIEIIPSIEVDLVALEEATKPDLSILNTVGEYGEDIANLPRHLRKKFNDNDNETAENIKQKLLKQWIIPFLNRLAGQPGTISIKNRKLTITYPDQYLVNQAKSAGLNIFLDATPDIEALVAMIGAPLSEWAFVKAKTEKTDNIDFIQVTEMGRLGMSRGAYQQKQVAAVINELERDLDNLDTPLKFRFKKYSQPGDLIHWVNSKGFNDGKNAKSMIIDGLACENIESLKARFSCIHGYTPTDETIKKRFDINAQSVWVDGQVQTIPKDQVIGIDLEVSADPKFAAFVHRRILANFWQEVGRLRANLRPDDYLLVYVLGEYPLDDVPVCLVPASEISPDAAPKGKAAINAVKQAIATLTEKGIKATQDAISAVTGFTQQNVSKVLQKIKTLTHWSFTTFTYSDLNSKICITDELYIPPPLPQETLDRWVVELMPEIANLSPVEIEQEIETLYDFKEFRYLWSQTASNVQQQILFKLYSLINPEYVRQIA